MKSKFIALSLLAGGMLFADDYYNNDMQDQRCGCSSCSSCSSCCSSSPCSSCSSCSTCCCVPKPKKCINCECYTPKFYDLQCAWDVALDVEFLYWYARDSNLAYAQRVQGKLRTFPQDPLITQNLEQAPNRGEYFHTSWDPGFRIGLGWNSSCDGWDVYLSWTWYQNKKRNSSTVDNFGMDTPDSVAFSFRFPLNGQFALLNPWLNTSFSRLAIGEDDLNAVPFLFDSISAKWKLQLNSIDLELGRKYWLSKCFAMRPYTGLRGAWTKTNFNTNSTRDFTNGVIGAVLHDSFQNRFTNRYWGVGLLAGLQPTWYFTPCFALYSNLDAALIWGKHRAQKRENYFESEVAAAAGITLTPVSYSNQATNEFFMMQSIIDLAIGLRWEDTWCCDRFRSTLDLGWEHHIWINHSHRLKTYDNLRGGFSDVPDLNYTGYLTFDDVIGDLMFGGLVIRVRFDF